MTFVIQEQSNNKMDTDPKSAHTELQIPQPLQPGILLESISHMDSPPSYSQYIQMQLTPYSYYGNETSRSDENQIPTNASGSSKDQFDDT